MTAKIKPVILFNPYAGQGVYLVNIKFLHGKKTIGQKILGKGFQVSGVRCQFLQFRIPDT
jgi:hypothetical protein